MSHLVRKSVCIVKYIFNETVLIIFGLTFVTVLTIAYILSIPIFVLRVSIEKAAKVIRPDLATIINPMGNIFCGDLFSSKSPRCSLVIPIIIQGSFSEQRFYKKLANMVNIRNKTSGKELYPQYKQYIENWLGFAFWKNDPHFDIQNHVKIHNSGDRVTTDQDLSDIVEELLNKRFQPQIMSPWELHVITKYKDPGLPDEDKFIFIFRVHHTLADGFSILYSLIQGLCDCPLSSLKLPTPVHVKRDKWDEFWFKLTFPIRVIHDLGNYFIKVSRANPLIVPDSKKLWRQIYARAKPIPMQKVKEIKDSLGVSFTSVLLAAVAASMSTILKARKEELSDRAPFFIPLTMPGGHPDELTNHATGAQIDLPLTSFSDPSLRVRDCEQQMNMQKASTIPWILPFLGRTFGSYFSFIAGSLTANRVNVGGLTSFPASRDKISYDKDSGESVISLEFAAGALTGVSGVAFMAVSYQKNLQFSVTAEASCLTKREVHGLLALIREEIDVLHKIVKAKV